MRIFANKYPFLLVTCLIAVLNNYGQEICNNAIDDDGDGLIDLQDPGCQCHLDITGNLLKNASFESADHCPTNYTYQADSAITSSWRFATKTAEAEYYHNLSCPFDSGHVMLTMPPVIPLPQGNGFISIYNASYVHPPPENQITKTYFSQCLDKPLKFGEDYTLSFSAGRFKSWDNLTGEIYPFTVAIYGNADCNASPFGSGQTLGNGCPENYPGWKQLGEVKVTTIGEWVQAKVKLAIPFDVNVIAIGPGCEVLPNIHDLADSTTFLDYHLYYLDDLHLLPTKEFPFEYIIAKAGVDCQGVPVLQAPNYPNALYQWYRDSIAILGAISDTLVIDDNAGSHFYNAVITTATKCITTEPFLATPSRLSEIFSQSDYELCKGEEVMIAPETPGITYLVNGIRMDEVKILHGGEYNITASDAYGCSKSFTVRAQERDCSKCDLYIPNAFSPNGDGVNDYFKPIVTCPVKDYRLQVFDRWGRKVFESSDVSEKWDGKKDGVEMSRGIYIYTVQLKTLNDVFEQKRGIVAIVR